MTQQQAVTAERDDVLAGADAVELIRRLRSGQVSPTEVTAAALERAHVVQRLNAVVCRIAPDPSEEGPFAGVPTFVKDNEDVAGHPTRHGSRASSATPARADSVFVDQFRGLGLTILGKSSLPEFGLTATTESVACGPTRNPWNLGRSTGGSSGGAAALVAAGVIPLAHANDGGGSIRIPAACCGLVGLKPSQGRLIDIEAMDEAPVPIATQGVLTRTVRDTALYYAQAEQRHPGPGLPPVGHVTGIGPRLRIGMYVEPMPGFRVDPATRGAVRAAGSLCAGLGHDVSEIGYPFGERFGWDFLRYWALIAAAMRRFGGTLVGPGFRPDLIEPFTRGLAGYGATVVERIPASLWRLRRFPQVYGALFERYDVLLSPVVSHAAPPIGYLGPDVAFRDHLLRLLRFASFTAVHNVAGAPGLSLPLGRSPDGLPLGVHFAAARGGERTLLQLALEVEAADPWPVVITPVTITPRGPRRSARPPSRSRPR